MLQGKESGQEPLTVSPCPTLALTQPPPGCRVALPVLGSEAWWVSPFPGPHNTLESDRSLELAEGTVGALPGPPRDNPHHQQGCSLLCEIWVSP